MTIQLAPGTLVVGRYEIIESTGQGGNAQVYRAHDKRLDTDIALKILWPQLSSDSTFIERFRREGQTLAKLTHPNILRLFELGEDENLHAYFLVLEYLTGGTLKDRLGPAPWPTDEALEVLKPVAAALDYAHTRKPPVVHRDLKPSNILFNTQGWPVVSDFGVARLLQAESLETSLTGDFVLGTPAYMAPEQVKGTTGPSSDRYALGVIAYELLVGRVPHQADTLLETLILVASTPPPAPRQLNPAIDQAVEDVLLKALQHDPLARYESAEQLVLALQQASHHGTADQTLFGSAVRRPAGDALTLGTPMPQTAPSPIRRNIIGPAPRAAAAADSASAVTPGPADQAASDLTVAVDSAQGRSRVNSARASAAPPPAASPSTAPKSGSVAPARPHSLSRRAVVAAISATIVAAGGALLLRDKWPLVATTTVVPVPPRMGVARSFFTATALAGGDVLVAGGQPRTGEYLASAERFEAEANRWSSAGEMPVARAGHTATLLNDGQVLVVGGQVGSNPPRFSSSVDRYDPLANAWAIAAPLATPRLQHAAVLLQPGHLLIAGGFSGAGYLRTAELFNPENTSWTTLSELASPRVAAAATRLPDGQVLVTGGFTGDEYLATAERYDPLADRWTAAGQMSSPRVWHTAAVLPNGQVLVAGGYVVAKDGTATFLPTAELYDPSVNDWRPAGAMRTPRSAHTATTLTDGTILVVGGQSGQPLKSAERYDSSTNTWAAAGQLSETRTQHQAVLLPGGQVLVLGGQTNPADSAATATAERYDPTTNRWSVAAALAHSTLPL